MNFLYLNLKPFLGKRKNLVSKYDYHAPNRIFENSAIQNHNIDKKNFADSFKGKLRLPKSFIFFSRTYHTKIINFTEKLLKRISISLLDLHKQKYLYSNFCACYSSFYLRKISLLTFIISSSFHKFLEAVLSYWPYKNSFLNQRPQPTICEPRANLVHGFSNLNKYIGNKQNSCLSFNPSISWRYTLFMELFNHTLKVNTGLNLKNESSFQVVFLNQQSLFVDSCFCLLYFSTLGNLKLSFALLEKKPAQKSDLTKKFIYDEKRTKKNFFLSKQNFYYFVYFSLQSFMLHFSKTGFYENSIFNFKNLALSTTKKILFNTDFSNSKISVQSNNSSYSEKQNTITIVHKNNPQNGQPEATASFSVNTLQPFSHKKKYFLSFLNESLNCGLKGLERTSDNLMFRFNQVLSFQLLNFALKETVSKTQSKPWLFYPTSVNFILLRKSSFFQDNKANSSFFKTIVLNLSIFNFVHKTSLYQDTCLSSVYKTVLRKTQSFYKLGTDLSLQSNNVCFILASLKKEEVCNIIFTKFKMWLVFNFNQVTQLFSKHSIKNKSLVLLNVFTETKKRNSKLRLLLSQGFYPLNSFLNFKNLTKKYSSISQANFIKKLTPLLYAYAYYERLNWSSQTIKIMDKQLFEFLWKWACRRHNNKSKKWIILKYFYKLNFKLWVFAFYNEKPIEEKKSKLILIYLPFVSQIQYHLSINF